MRAVVYKGAHEVEVEEVDDPRVEQPTDVVVRITTAAICSSDLHMYEGRTAAEPGLVFGHENMGVVEEVGPGVSRLRPGDRVVCPSTWPAGSARTARRGTRHSVRPTGRLGVVGLYLPQDPGAPIEEAAEGRLLFEMGRFFEKGQTMGTGQANLDPAA